MKLNTLILAACLLGGPLAAGQDPRAEAEINHRPYLYTEGRETPVPKGYKPFYISHYGRHGSRYHGNGSFLRKCLGMLDSCARDQVLTETGLRVRDGVQAVLEEHSGMYGMLSERGMQEHRGIGERMVRRTPAVFAHRTQLRVASSYWPRCLMSMQACTDRMRQLRPDLRFSVRTGVRVLDTLCMNLPPAPSQKYAWPAERSYYEQGDFRHFLAVVLQDTSAARKLGPHYALPRLVYLSGLSCHCTDSRADLLSVFTEDELRALSAGRSTGFYGTWCMTAETAAHTSIVAGPLLELLVKDADEALKTDSPRAADLRFGHDSGLIMLGAALGVEGFPPADTPLRDIASRWNMARFMPMGANLQMVFYRNRKGEVLVKLLWNERETRIPALPCIQGCYYRWEDLRSRMLSFVDGLDRSRYIRDELERERVGR